MTVDTFRKRCGAFDALRLTTWTQWSNEGTQSFQVVSGAGLGASNGLATSGDSKLAARTWLINSYEKDVQVQADIYLSSLSPVQLFARGANLSTSTPTYYAVSVTRGMEVDLLRVNDGKTTVLATVVSNSYLSNQWVRVNFTVNGNQLTVQVFRTDTAQYLGPDDQWHSTPTIAIAATDSVVTNAGRVGFARAPGVSGQVVMDNFGVSANLSTAVPTPLIDQNFNANLVSGLPSGWSSYTNTRNQQFQVSASASAPTGTATIGVTGSTGLVARAWSNATLPADVQVSASLFLNNLAPAQIFARGQNLATDSPDYYAVSLTRGRRCNCISVIDGATTVLGNVSTDAWVGSQWVQATLSISGTTLSVQVYRTDIGQYLTPTGEWQVAPTWAIQMTDTAILGPGQAGIGRAAGYSGTVTFDSFVVTTTLAPVTGSSLLNNFNSTPVGGVPAGWSSWTQTGVGAFQVAGPTPPNTANGFASNGPSNAAARAWFNTQSFDDVQFSASVYLDGLVPGQLLVRGQNLNSASPSYYAVSITRGLDVQLLRVINGTTTVLATIDSAAYLSNLWVTVGLQVQADTLEVFVSRPDTGQYLTASGGWQTGQTAALSATDDALTSGYIGVNRPASYTGRVLFTNLSLVNLNDASGSSPPPDPPSTTTTTSGGSGTSASSTGVEHYPYIRVAELAYYGTPIGNNEIDLLRSKR